MNVINLPQVIDVSLVEWTATWGVEACGETTARRPRLLLARTFVKLCKAIAKLGNYLPHWAAPRYLSGVEAA
jgi:hypothetical protein